MKCALLNATSVASMLLTTESAIVEKKKDEQANGINPNPGMMFV
jgi:chaperonin GroEL (HSP60 family)